MTTLSRRHLVTTAAALPALAVPAAAMAMGSNSPDPIFAAIEKFEALEAEHLRLFKLEPADANDRPYFDTPEHDAWEAASDAASDKCWKAKDALLATVPTTAAGALAFLKLFLSPELRFLVEDDEALFDSLIVYLERAAAQS